MTVGDDVLFQTLDGEVVLLNMETEQYYGLNDSGARIWELLLELGSAEAVADRLATVYEVERETLLADVSLLVADLSRAGLLKNQ